MEPAAHLAPHSLFVVILKMLISKMFHCGDDPNSEKRGEDEEAR